MISKLPVELKIAILEQSPKLRFTNREFYILHNEVYKNKTLRLIRDQSIFKISKLLEFFGSTFDFWNGALRKMYEPDLNWVLIYSLLKNRKIFFQQQDFVVQSDTLLHSLPTSTANFVHISAAHAFHYQKVAYLPNGRYNLQIALRNLESSRGLGTTRFQIHYLNQSRTEYPPSIINEILPKNQLSVLNLFDFTINNSEQDLTQVEIVIEEIGMYPKVDLIFDYLEFKQTESEYLYYTMPGDPFQDYSKFVNTIEKQCYLAIDELWDPLRSVALSPCHSLESFNELIQESDEDEMRTYAKDFYTKSFRKVRMLYPGDQRNFREPRTGKLLAWRVPLLR